MSKQLPLPLKRSPIGPQQTIHNEDCLSFLQKKPDRSIGTVVTSPPYNIGIAYGNYNDQKPEEEYMAWMDQVFAQIRRTLVLHGHFFLNIGESSKNRLYAAKLALLASKYFKLQNTIIWVKSITVNGVSKGHFKPIAGKCQLNDLFEYIYHFTPEGNSPLDRLAIGVPYQHKSNLTRWKKSTGEDKRCGGNVWFLPYKTVTKGSKKTTHPATFPIELAERCILLAGKHQPIYDPFAGIGTTLVAARKHKLEAFGTETDPVYFAEAEQNLQ
jgi:site-specific DNA-methyltransferase (adenine-specific)